MSRSPNAVPATGRTSCHAPIANPHSGSCLPSGHTSSPILLWVAAGLAAIAGMPQLAVAIAVVVLINGVFAFIQEHRAERAADRLQDLLPKQVTVRRGGEIHVVDAVDLVRGDVVLLAAGDRVCADMTLVVATSLAIDTSTMTGESVPAHPSEGELVLAGTFVVEGEGQAVVTEIGADTELAGIAELSQGPSRRDSPLTAELNRLVRVIAAIAVGIGIGFMAVSLLVGMPATDGFLFGVGRDRRARSRGPPTDRHVVTGDGRQADVAQPCLGAPTWRRSRRSVRRRSSAPTRPGRSRATRCRSSPFGHPQSRSWCPRRTATTRPRRSTPRPPAANSFGGRRRWRGAAPTGGSTDVTTADGRRSETRWRPRSTSSPDAAQVPNTPIAGPATSVRPAPTTHVDRPRPPAVGQGRARFGAAVVRQQLPRSGSRRRRYASAGWRTLAIAQRELQASEVDSDSADDVERELELVAILAFEDPPRPAARAAIAACRRAGIRVAMITGDHPATALAIAREVGLAIEGAPVLVGSELPDDEQVLGALVDRDGVVVARVSPEHKLRIAAALRQRGHVVAMTGDGVNDGPALHEADIGIAMGRSGTDVARESADLVLLDDDFATIVRAIEQGRSTFTNIRRFLTYHLTDNVAELTPFVIWALSGGRFPLAIGVLQVLALDIGTDMLPALALGGEPPRPGLLDRPPISGHLIDRHVMRRAFGLLGPVEALVAMTAFVAVLTAGGWSPGSPLPSTDTVMAASGAAFTAVVLGQMATALGLSQHVTNDRRGRVARQSAADRRDRRRARCIGDLL